MVIGCYRWLYVVIGCYMCVYRVLYAVTTICMLYMYGIKWMQWDSMRHYETLWMQWDSMRQHETL